VNEQYLHFIWNNKRLPFHNIKTANNESVEFIHVGNYNEFQSGPDFSMAKVRIDGLVWVGSIELHVNSSDWYRHKHHLDKAYNNVILHVVYIHDKDVEINGRKLPVVELKPHIEFDHFLKYSKLQNNIKKHFPCQSLFNQKYLIELESMKIQCVQNRLDKKTKLKNTIRSESDDFIFLSFIASAFGSSVNSQPFEELINSFSIDEIKNFEEENLVEVLSRFFWRRKGLFSNPEKRLRQFIAFLNDYDFEVQFWEFPTSMIPLYIEQQFKKASLKSSFLLNNFIINCVVRFIYWKGKKLNNPIFIKKALRLLEITPKESNHLTKKWGVMGVQPKNGFESQALLEIYEQFCSKKACLDCAIGKKILTV
jgi:hypothetical protein